MNDTLVKICLKIKAFGWDTPCFPSLKTGLNELHFVLQLWELFFVKT